MFERIFHPDEANQAMTVGRLLETGHYTYQPGDHHGPTLYYAAAGIQRAFGHTTTASMDGNLLRATPLLFAVAAAVLGFIAVRKLLQSWWAALLFTVILCASPMFIFFATDFIQEMLLVTFSMGMLCAGAHYTTAKKPGKAALWFGICAGLAFATKETCLITFAAAAIALAVTKLTTRFNDIKFSALHLQLAAAGFTLTAILFYSSFCSDWHGLYNAFIAAPLAYLHRGAGGAESVGAAWHVHPWWMYFKWLFLGETFRDAPMHWTATAPHLTGIVPTLLGAIVLLIPRFRRNITVSEKRLLIFALTYFAAIMLIYSCIPYKTPWCALQILPAYALCTVLGLYLFIKANGPTALQQRFVTPLVAFVVSLVTINTDYVPTYWLLAKEPNTHTVPYNYAGASPDVLRIAQLATEKLQHPEHDGIIAVALPACDTWPLPWYLRSVADKVGYWTDPAELKALASTLKPDVIILPARGVNHTAKHFLYLRNRAKLQVRPNVFVTVIY